MRPDLARLSMLSEEDQDPYLFDINSGSDDFYVIEGKLRALGHNIAVDHNHRAAIVVQSITIASLLVSV